MTNEHTPLSKEDYEEPNCVLCMDQDAPSPIPRGCGGGEAMYPVRKAAPPLASPC